MKINNTKVFSLIVASASLVGSALFSSGQNVVWQDVHTGSPLDFLYEVTSSNSGSDVSYTGTWNLLDKGYSLNQPISSISVWFKFADDSPGDFEGAESNDGGDIEEYVDISLGNTKIWDDLEVDGRHPATTYTSYAMDLDPAINAHASVFNSLKANGTLSYSVVLQDRNSRWKGREDTYLKEAGIKATFKPFTTTTNRVPDGGTGFALLGIGLAGVACLRKGFSLKNTTQGI